MQNKMFTRNEKNLKTSQYYTAFTLAEVLITLAVIGIIATITIPTLINNINDAQYKTAYKKAYSVASQAWESAYADNALEPRASWDGEQSNLDNFNQFMLKFSVIKTCTNLTTYSDCWAANETSDVMWGLPSSNAASICFIDKSGTSWCSAGNWGYIIFDTNGLKSPNKYGLDRFSLFSCVGGVGDESSCINTPGTPNTLKLYNDYTYNMYTCPNGNSHPCYYSSWLYN